MIPEIRTFPQGEIPAVGALYSHFTHASHYRPPTTQVAVRLRESPTPDRLLGLREAATAADPSLRVLRIETATQRRTAFLGAGALTALAVAVFGVAGLVMAVVAVLGQGAPRPPAAGPASSPSAAALGASPARSQWEAARPIVIADARRACCWEEFSRGSERPNWSPAFRGWRAPSRLQAALPGLLVAGISGIGAWGVRSAGAPSRALGGNPLRLIAPLAQTPAASRVAPIRLGIPGSPLQDRVSGPDEPEVPKFADGSSTSGRCRALLRGPPRRRRRVGDR